jgi:hypothetical protein
LEKLRRYAVVDLDQGHGCIVQPTILHSSCKGTHPLLHVSFKVIGRATDSHGPRRGDASRFCNYHYQLHIISHLDKRPQAQHGHRVGKVRVVLNRTCSPRTVLSILYSIACGYIDVNNSYRCAKTHPCGVSQLMSASIRR